GQPWYGKVEVRQADVTDAESLAAHCQDASAVIHCAGLAHRSAADELHRAVNYQGTLNLLQAAIAAKVPRFIFLSSSKAGASTQNAYATAKLAAEREILAATRDGNIQACALRPAAVYGLGMKGNLAGWIRVIERGYAPPIPPVRTRIALIGVEDLCRAIVVALESEHVWGKAYLVSDGVPHSIKEIETRIRQALGGGAASLWLPRPAFALAAATGDFMRNLGIDIPFGRAGYNTLFCDEYAGDAAFQRDTGFSPRQDFYQELPKLLKEQQC